MSVNITSLIQKINRSARSALEGAGGLCVSRTHYNVELEHFLAKLLEQPDGDFAKIIHRFGIDPSRLEGDLSNSLDQMKAGNARTPSFSPELEEMLKEAWTIASLDFDQGVIRTGHAVLALYGTPRLARQIKAASGELGRVELEALRGEFDDIVAGSVEEGQTGSLAAAGAEPGHQAGEGKTQFLDQFTHDLTEQARSGKLDPVLGRDAEIRQCVDILMRRRQNNPILTGEAGVGKTAVVEGFAARVAEGDVPPPLRNVAVRSLDLTLMQAGASVKGEFENRMKGLLEEVKSSETPIILFIDEAHTMIGAGGQEGQGDAANLLKPALARGELRTIAATTWSEYKKYFEKDPALTRRFQVVKVEEPTEDVCQVMLRGVAATLEKHHQVRILDEALAAAVGLSHRYIAGRQLPDKAVSVLDTACARLALAQSATPAQLEDVQRRLDDLSVQERILQRESAAGADHSERLGEITAARADLEKEKTELEERHGREKDLVEQALELRLKLEGHVDGETLSDDERTAALAESEKLTAELAELQGEKPMVGVCVDKQIVSEVISAWTGIPVGKMLKDEFQTVLSLADLLNKRVVGQDHALESVSRRITTARANLDDPNRPVGVFMMVGPSGVGKTETALALADLLYGGERNLITINMSEYQESHTVSSLKGSPPGYVGFGEGGVLTEAVRRRPYSVVLLDEVEKAHSDVLELFYQVFDKGMMEDGEGREIDFKNTIIILTSNACTDQIMQLTADPETAPSPTGLVKAIKADLDKIFKPAFLGRMMIVPYFPIRDEALKMIIGLKLGKIRKALEQNHRIAFTYDDALVDAVADRCTEVESGARNIDHILTNSMLPEIARRLLGLYAVGDTIDKVHVSVGEDGSFVYA